MEPWVSVPTAGGCQIGGRGHGRAAARAVGLEGPVGVAGLAAQGAEAVGHAEVHPVGPLRQVGLAQDDRARVPQLLHQEGVAVGLPILERVGAGGGVHAVAGGDVVLEQHGDAVHVPAHLARGPFRIQLAGDVERLRVELHHRIQLVDIVALDPVDVVGDEFRGGQFAAGHRLLHVEEGGVGQQRVQFSHPLCRQPGQGIGKGAEIAHALGGVVRLGPREGQLEVGARSGCRRCSGRYTQGFRRHR